MDNERAFRAFLNKPEKRHLLVRLFLKHGRAYRAKSRTIDVTDLREEDVGDLMNCGFIAEQGGQYELTGLGRTIGYGLLERHEFRKRLKASPNLRIIPDVPFPEAPLTAGKVFIDVGCGSGAFVTAAAQSQAKMAFGIDLQMDLLKIAQSMGGDDGSFLLSGRAEAIPLVSGVGEVVFLRGILPYVDNKKTLAETARITASGAELFITTLGPGYYLTSALDAIRNQRILHLFYVLLVLLNGAMHRFFHIRMPLYLKKYDSPELLSIFNTHRELTGNLRRLGFSIMDTKVNKELGILSNLFIRARKR